MRRNKTQRKLEFDNHPLALVGHPHVAGKWRAFLGADAPLVLELGCGKGDFLLEYARRFPDSWIIGLDVKKERLWKAAIRAAAEGLGRVRLLRENILIIEQVFGAHELDEIWITFPDPYPKKAHEDRRLTAPHFLAAYRRLLRPGGRIHFKTDNADLFAYSLMNLRGGPLRILSLSDDLHANPWLDPKAYFETAYERRFRAEGLPIRYVCAEFV